MASLDGQNDSLTALRHDLASLRLRTNHEITDLENRLSLLEKNHLSRKPPKLPTNRPESPTPPQKAPPRPAKTTAPVKAVGKKTKPAATFEAQFGKVWLVRIGIALLITGLVLLGNYAYQNWVRELPNWVRLLSLFGASLGLCGIGHTLGLRSHLKRFGEVILGGGLAFFYWCCYAAYHIPRLQVIQSPVLATLILLASAFAIVSVSLKRKSELIALMGLLLASYAVTLHPPGWLSGLSNLFLAIAGLGLVYGRSWTLAGGATLLGTYGSLLWWIAFGNGGTIPDYQWLIPVWILFALPGISPTAKRFRHALHHRQRLGLAIVNNSLFFALLSLSYIKQFSTAEYWIVPGIIGTTFLGIGIYHRGKEVAASVYLGQGLALLFLATLLKVSGYQLPLVLAFQALSLAVFFHKTRGRIELVFTFLLALTSAFLSLNAKSDGGVSAFFNLQTLPLWTALFTSSLLTAASFVITATKTSKAELRLDHLSLIGSVILTAATAILIFCAWTGLRPDLRMISSALAVLVITGSYWLTFGKQYLPSLSIPSIAFATCLLFSFIDLERNSPAALVTCLLSSLVASVLWQKLPARVTVSKDLPCSLPDFLAYFLALLLVLSIWTLGLQEVTSSLGLIVFTGISVLSLQALAHHVFRAFPLSLAATLSFPLAITPLLDFGPSLSLWVSLLPTLIGLSAIAIGRIDRSPESTTQKVSLVSLRFLTSLTWLLVLTTHFQSFLSNALSLTALGIFIIHSLTKRSEPSKFPKEALLFLALSFALFLYDLSVYQFELPIYISTLRHFCLQVTLVSITLLRPLLGKLTTGPQKAFITLALATLTIWLTQVTATLSGWTAITILWTACGATYVALGLAIKTSQARKIGFSILALAFFKLFLIDVWDFEAFARVAAFISLGACLIGLGFYYNRVGDLLKGLLEDEPSDD